MTDLILRDYQVTDIARLRNAYSWGNRAVLYQLATGGGKTVVFSHVVQGAVAKGKRVAVLAHRRELIELLAAQKRTNRLLQAIIYDGIGFVLGLIAMQVLVRVRLF